MTGRPTGLPLGENCEASGQSHFPLHPPVRSPAPNDPGDLTVTRTMLLPDRFLDRLTNLSAAKRRLAFRTDRSSPAITLDLPAPLARTDPPELPPGASLPPAPG